MLDVKSTSKGLLPPRMTFAQRNAIASPEPGLLVICTNCLADGSATLSIYLGGQWINFSGNCTLPTAPAEGTHTQTGTSIIWNWSAVPIALGYKWNSINDYASATAMGSLTSKTETGLTTGSSYTRYVWAYNACGQTSATTLTGQALSCGSSFTVNHWTGSVAPVDKTVTYGTTTNIPGEPAKCWITRNLGATQQPNAKSDATEPAAGWYWQFNLKQGYKHDGVTRTPNTTWITSISENSDWTAINDPCRLLLGVAWHIPAMSEWNNIISAGGWTNWNGPWGSALQLNGAGLLNSSTGSLTSPGAEGVYWCNSQSNSFYAAAFDFSASYCFVGSGGNKGLGLTNRCIRN